MSLVVSIKEPQEKSAFLNIAAQAFQARDLGFRVFEAHFHVKNFMDRPIKQKRVVMVTASSLILLTVISEFRDVIDQGHLITFNCNQPLYFYYNEYNTPVHF